jgi:hypothetical protein
MLARLYLERGDAAGVLAACAEPETAGGHVAGSAVVACARLWRGWAQADAGMPCDVCGADALPNEDGWIAARWGVVAAAALRAGEPARLACEEPDVWRLPGSSLLAPLVVAAWAARVE